MNWMAFVILHAVLTLTVVLLAAAVRLIVWLLTSRRGRLG